MRESERESVKERVGYFDTGVVSDPSGFPWMDPVFSVTSAVCSLFFFASKSVLEGVLHEDPLELPQP